MHELSKELQIKLCQEYTSGIRGVELSKKYKISPGGVYSAIRRNGGQVRTPARRKYELDENIFEKIDSEWKAYFLGLFYADGCVQKNKSLIIALHEKDKEVLDAINSFIFPKYPLGYIPAKTYNSKGRVRNNSPKYYIRINSEKVWNDIQNLGCSMRKSLTLQFPNFTIVPEYLFHHFLRGYFDGDGCFTKPTVGIVSSKDFCIGLLKFLDSKNIESHLSICGKVARVQVWKKSEVQKFYDYIYRDASVFLERKRLAFSCIHKKPALSSGS